MKKMFFFIILLLLPSVTWAQEITGLEGWTIYLDPGHSRTENMGIYNYSEAQKVLRVGLALQKMLLDRTDIEDAYISRENDQVSVGLSERSDEANQLGADWYHSIHSNAGSSTANNTLLLWGQYSDGREKVPNGGKAMSDIMLQNLTDGYRIPTIGSRGDCSFYGGCNGGPYLSVNRRTTMPSELSEGGFHTHPIQNMRNMNADWKRLEAYTFFWSILQLHEIQLPPIGIVTGYITDKETGLPLNGVRVQLGDSVVVTDTFQSLFNKYTTNPDLLHNGFFFFEDLPDTTFSLKVEKEGYYPDSMQVTIQNDFFTFADMELLSSTPPQVTSTIPANGDTSVSILALIQLNFNREMDRATVENALQITPNISTEFIWQNGDKRLIINPESLVPLTEYKVILDTTAHDSRGVSIDGNVDGIAGDPFEFTFTTGIDNHAPTVLTVYPLNGVKFVELRPVVNIVFDELLNDSTHSADLFSLFISATGEKVAGTWKFYNSYEQTSVNFFPEVDLEPGTLYKIKIDTGVADLLGNATRIIRNFSFTTGENYFNVTSIDDFDSGITENWWQPHQSGSTFGIDTDSTRYTLEGENTNLITQSTGAMKISYGWDSATSSHLLRLYLSKGAPRAVEFDKEYTLQAYVFGDGSGNGFRFALDDNLAGSGGHEVSPWFVIDWIGWKLVTWDMMNDGVGSWIGDGILDDALRIDSFQMTYFEGANRYGEIIVDDLRVVKSIPLGITEETVEFVPTSITLHQNYPNPFNPETTISFSIPQEQSEVKLVIYDILGKKVREVAQGNFGPGMHEFVWDGKNKLGQQMPSGIYVYFLKTADFVAAKRMMLLK
ncbi:MAG: T9SS C-terminal target domain-containing protein [Calditrichaeota bacterium]|nr:MAG: T9SS C-terminal target domain-containing protein [Calditrichota bacterium]